MTATSEMPALVPELLVRNLAATLNFYKSILGFEVAYERPENKFATLRLGQAWLMVEETPSCSPVTEEQFVKEREWRTAALEYPFGRGINFQIEVTDVMAIYDGVSRQGYPVKCPLEERWYRVGDECVGVRQFLLVDPDGYLLRLQQDIEVRPAAI